MKHVLPHVEFEESGNSRTFRGKVFLRRKFIISLNKN